MVYPILDMNNNVVTPTVVLCHRNKHKIGAIYPISEWSITPDMYNKNECSFKVHKEVNGIETPLWDKIKDLKVFYIPEYNEYFQISIDKTQTNETVKTITGSNLGIAELSQTMLYDIEINTEDDIARDAYKMAYIYDPTDVSNSLLGRVLSKAPHYKIKHVDASLCKLVRSFSISDKSIYDFLTGDLADELNCLIWVDSYDRSISIYDLENSCPKCGHRAENETVCSECRTHMKKGYGEYFNVPVSNDNLSDSISVTTKDDEVKNTFRIQGGDDVINAAIRAVNPNGTEYINRFASFQTEDMSDELVNKINKYQELYESKKKPYKEIMNGLYDTIDQILYLTSSMMPSPETDDTDATKELAKLTADNLGMIAVQNLRVAGVTTVNNAVKSMVDIYMSAGYKVEIVSSTYSNQVWNGRFKVTSVDDEDDTATNSSDITLLITDDYETFITQKIQKILDKQDMSDEECDWTKYGLNRLSSFSDAYQSCIDVLIDAGVGDPNHEFYSSIYLTYYNKKLEVDKEIQVREAQIKEQEDKEAEYENQRDNIQTELNFEKYLGKDLYSEYCLYRREDTYQNDNYISDGLSNSEILSKAEELLEVAQKEIVKASELQVDLSTDVGNIWTIDEFKEVLDQWKCGNWIRVICDDDIYELRLLNYTIKDSDFSKISCDFSSVLKVSDGISDIKSVLDSAKSMAGSYESVKRQAKNAQETGKTVSEWVEHGMNATAVAIRDSDSQSITYDNHGLLARTYDDITGEYEPEQLKVVNNTLAITDDNWKTVKAAIGKIHYEDPKHPGDMLSAYGVLGETIIGKLLLGEALGIYNDGGSLKFDKNGLSISNGVNSFIVNPNNETLLSLSNTSGQILWVDTKGLLHIQGDGAGIDFNSNQTISEIQSNIETTNKNLEQTNQSLNKTNSDLSNTNSQLNKTNQKIDGEIERATKTEKEMSASFSATVEGINGKFTTTETTLKKYADTVSSTAQSNAITASNSSTDDKLKNYSTTEASNNYADTVANQAKTDAIAESNNATDDKLKNYTTTVVMNNKFDLTAKGFTEEITKETTRATGEEEKLSTSINAVAGQLVLKVDANGRIAQVSLDADAKDGTTIKLTGDNLDLTSEYVMNLISNGALNLGAKNLSIVSDNFNVTSDGTVTMKKANITGGTLNIGDSQTNESDAIISLSYGYGDNGHTEEGGAYGNVKIKPSGLSIYNQQGDRGYGWSLGTDLSYTGTKAGGYINCTGVNTEDINVQGNESVISTPNLTASNLIQTSRLNVLKFQCGTNATLIKGVRTGSCACKGTGGTSVELSNVTASARAVYFATNIDGNTCNAHVEGTTLSNGKVYAVLDRQLSISEIININWCKIEW